MDVTEADEPFADRREAGRSLAGTLTAFRGRDDVVVLALPRGGVPVGYEVARSIGAPLDVLVVRKLGTPGHEELAMGAIASGDVTLRNADVLAGARVDESAFEEVVERERAELGRRERTFRGEPQGPEVSGRAVIVVDDGVATGSTMKAALEAVRYLDPAEVVMAVPVGSPEVCEEMRSLVDEVVCLRTPHPLYSVGTWYLEFSQTTDAEVIDLMSQDTTRRGR